MPKRDIDVTKYLALAGFKGDAIELVVQALEEPRELPLGVRAGLSIVLEQAAKVLGEDARKEALSQLGPGKAHRYEFAQDGIHFSWVAPTEPVTLNTDKLKVEFPQEEYPDYYKTGSRKESASMVPASE